jgi:hypothetical protein
MGYCGPGMYHDSYERVKFKNKKGALPIGKLHEGKEAPKHQDELSIYGFVKLPIFLIGI